MLSLPVMVLAADFSVTVEHVDLQLEGNEHVLQANGHYRLSPKAKEAIDKGVPLSWILRIKLQRHYWFWYRTVHERSIPYIIRYEALLNQYSVTNRNTGRQEMFATLNTALSFMGAIREPVWPGRRLALDSNDRLAVKLQFDREFLPIPLRPESYFDTQWALSSDWLIWHPQK